MRPGSASRGLRLAALIPVALTALWFVFLRPPLLGGDTTYLVVNGQSMEPTLYTYDLVVIKQADTYEVGDILAFQVGGGLVIHRAIDGDQDSGFVMQGDNRDSEDPWQPTTESIIGQYVVDIPMGGYVVTWLGQPIVFGVAVVGISLVGSSFGARRVVSRRRRRRMQPDKGNSGGMTPGSGIGSWWPGSVRMFIGMVIATVTGSLLAALAALAFWNPAEGTEYVEELAYDHTSTFDYRAQVETSTLYPDGTLAPVEGDDGAMELPQPMYTALSQSMTIDYSYGLSTLLQPTTTGEIAADLVIRSGDGWTHSEPLMTPRRFEGPNAEATFDIDFAALRALVEQIETETNFTPAAYTLSVEPRITLEGDLGGHAIEETYLPTFEIEYTRTRITPPTELESSETVSVGEDVPIALQMSVLGMQTSVSNWRAIGLAGALVSLAVAGGIAAVVYLGLGQREDERIQARYRGMLVPVDTNGSTPAATSIHVASMADLARLAQRDGGIIFQESGPTTRRYFVRDGQDTYDYTVSVSRQEQEQGPTATTSLGGSEA